MDKKSKRKTLSPCFDEEPSAIQKIATAILLITLFISFFAGIFTTGYFAKIWTFKTFQL